MRPDQARSLPEILDDENVGGGIAKLRSKIVGETQAELGKRFHLSRQQVAFIESGRRPITATLGWNICKMFNCHPDWILWNGGPEEVPPPLEALPIETRSRIERKIQRYGNVLFRDFFGLLRLGANLNLTDTSENRKYESVKSEIDKLLGRVRRQVSERGMKSRLAAELEVPQSRLSEWLAGTCEPSGETTLRLLHWVEAQERQK